MSELGLTPGLRPGQNAAAGGATLKTSRRMPSPALREAHAILLLLQHPMRPVSSNTVVLGSGVIPNGAIMT